MNKFRLSTILALLAPDGDDGGGGAPAPSGSGAVLSSEVSGEIDSLAGGGKGGSSGDGGKGGGEGDAGGASDDDDITGLMEAGLPKKPDEKEGEGGKEEGEGEKKGDEDEEGEEREEGKKADEKKSTGPKQLRQELEVRKAELASLRKEVETLRKSGSEDAVKAVQEELRQAREEASKLKERIRAVDFRESDEFKNGYVKPIKDEFMRAVSQLGQLDVVDKNGGTRKGTDEDVRLILGAPSLEEASKIASRMFGGDPTKAALALSMREKIVDLFRKRDEAIESASQQTEAQRKAQEVQMQEEARRVESIWEGRIIQNSDQYPDIYKPSDDDAEGKDLMAKGRKLVDIAFKNPGGLDIDTITTVRGEVAARATALPYVAAKLRRAENELTSLRAQLSKLKKSDPGSGAGPKSGDERRSSKGTLDEALDEIGQMAKPYRR